MSVFKNNNGVWGFKVRINGKQIKRESRDWKKRDAELAERAFLNEYVEVKENITLNQVHNKMMKETNIKAKSEDFYRRTMLRMNMINDIPLSKLTAEDIKKWQKQLNNNYSGTTLKTTQSYLKRLIRYAYDNEYISDDKLSNFKIINPERKKKIKQEDFYTLDDYNKLVECLDNDKDRLIYRLLMFTGMRIGELLALQVKHVNGNRITIEQTLGMKYDVTTPKTLNSYRVVILDDTTSKMLGEYIKGLESAKNVVTRNYYVETYNAFLQRHLKRQKVYNLKKIKIHGFRHSHVSLLINKGFSSHDIADRIGDTVTMVNEVYGHLYEDNQKKIANALNNL